MNDHPSFRMEIEYEDGNKVILYSNSNCIKQFPGMLLLKANCMFSILEEFQMHFIIS